MLHMADNDATLYSEPLGVDAHGSPLAQYVPPPTPPSAPAPAFRTDVHVADYGLTLPALDASLLPPLTPQEVRFINAVFRNKFDPVAAYCDVYSLDPLTQSEVAYIAARALLNQPEIQAEIRVRLQEARRQWAYMEQGALERMYQIVREGEDKTAVAAAKALLAHFHNAAGLAKAARLEQEGRDGTAGPAAALGMFQGVLMGALAENRR